MTILTCLVEGVKNDDIIAARVDGLTVVIDIGHVLDICSVAGRFAMQRKYPLSAVRNHHADEVTSGVYR